MRLRRVAFFLLRNGLLGLALLATAGLAAVVTLRTVLDAQEVSVPDLEGRPITEAGSLVARRRLLLRVEGRRYDARVPAGRIVAQDPGPGATLKTSRSVRVWVSMGPKRIAVPDVVGQSLRTARLALSQAEVGLAHVLEVERPEPQGTVVLQQPPPGEMDASRLGASLLVSRGPSGRDYLMPDLIGRRGEEVLERLRLAGLKVSSVRYRAYPGVAPGIVLRQSPASGHPVNDLTAIGLEISREAQ